MRDLCSVMRVLNLRLVDPTYSIPQEHRRRKTRTQMALVISKVKVAAQMEKLKSALEKKNSQDLAEELNEEMKFLDSTTLNIAITGVTGAGKSSLVNALRGMSDSEEGAAETGVVETTMKPNKYPHPTFENVVFWDLPGIGTENFQAKEYLRKTNFAVYDFFIVVSAERFTQHDVRLAKEIRKMKKNYYFVRSKVDQSMEAEKKKLGSTFNEEKTLEKIREYCCENLRVAGEANPRVFLLSSWYLSMYDFSLLQNTLANELNDLKKQVLIESMPAFSREDLKKKKAAMKAHIWKLAFVSCVIGIIPVPGLSLVVDISILVVTLVKFCKVFGLDEKSLGRLAKRVGKPIDELKSAIQKVPLANQINKEFVIELLAKSFMLGVPTLIELVLYFVPVLGSLVGGGASFAATFYILKSFLKGAKEDAENVRVKVAELLDKRVPRDPSGEQTEPMSI